MQAARCQMNYLTISRYQDVEGADPFRSFHTSNPHSEINIEDEDEDCEVDVVDVDDSTARRLARSATFRIGTKSSHLLQIWTAENAVHSH
uniref:Uncharacterized protein n=1 Tax=Ditylenchus dipsaci TaxID=166011 RepID=A0A915DHJ1_9BILA